MNWRKFGAVLKKALSIVGVSAEVAPIPDKAKRVIRAVDQAEGVIEGAVRDAVREIKR